MNNTLVVTENASVVSKNMVMRRRMIFLLAALLGAILLAGAFFMNLESFISGITPCIVFVDGTGTLACLIASFCNQAAL